MAVFIERVLVLFSTRGHLSRPLPAREFVTPPPTDARHMNSCTQGKGPDALPQLAPIEVSAFGCVVT